MFQVPITKAWMAMYMDESKGLIKIWAQILFYEMDDEGNGCGVGDGSSHWGKQGWRRGHVCSSGEVVGRFSNCDSQFSQVKLRDREQRSRAKHFSATAESDAIRNGEFSDTLIASLFVSSHGFPQLLMLKVHLVYSTACYAKVDFNNCAATFLVLLKYVQYNGLWESTTLAVASKVVFSYASTDYGLLLYYSLINVKDFRVTASYVGNEEHGRAKSWGRKICRVAVKNFKSFHGFGRRLITMQTAYYKEHSGLFGKPTPQSSAVPCMSWWSGIGSQMNHGGSCNLLKAQFMDPPNGFPGSVEKAGLQSQQLQHSSNQVAGQSQLDSEGMTMGTTRGQLLSVQSGLCLGVLVRKGHRALIMPM
eukprot:Gb_31429 [translate_table: standard]